MGGIFYDHRQAGIVTAIRAQILKNSIVSNTLRGATSGPYLRALSHLPRCSDLVVSRGEVDITRPSQIGRVCCTMMIADNAQIDIA